MRRAFISLYVLIVAAILISGWSLDRAYQQSQPSNVISGYQQSLMQLISRELTGLTGADVDAAIASLSPHIAVSLQRYELSEFAGTDLAAQIAQGQTVLINDASRGQRLYRRLPDSETVISLVQPPVNGSGRHYIVFLLLFYAVLGGVIYLWLWPLSRDLRQLELHTKDIGRENGEKLYLGRDSTVRPLAEAFNTMSARITDLLTSRRDMTYAVSHELRTPLARMKFALELAQQSTDPAQIRRNLSSLRDDVAALEDFVNELLGYASFDQHSQQLTKSSGAWTPFAQSLSNQIDEERIHLTINNRRNSDIVYCDWPLMERAVSNLVLNATRYSRGKIILTLDGDKAEYCIHVDDDGCGIPEQDRDKIWQPFVSLHNHNDCDQSSGYGLGLAIVKRVAQWHGGSATAGNRPEGGARFTLRWPVPAP